LKCQINRLKRKRLAAEIKERRGLLPIDYDKSLSQLKSVFKVDEFEAGDKQGGGGDHNS